MTTRVKNCTGVILAGGENTRLPVLKSFIEVNGQKIIEQNLNIMKKLFNEVLLVTNQPEKYLYLDIPMLGDIHDTRGPLTGIFTALLNSSNPWIFVTACDMPFINIDLIRYLSLQRKSCSAVVPESAQHKSEPLFSFYSKQLAKEMEKAVKPGNRGVKDFLKDKKVKYVPSGEIKDIDSEFLSFVNLNTPEDIKHFLGARDIVKFNSKATGRKHVWSWRN